MTPGVLCSFLDTLLRFAQEHPHTFPPAYWNDLTLFWQKTAELLHRHNARSDGFPLK